MGLDNPFTAIPHVDMALVSKLHPASSQCV
jgi:hypothetical protein